MADKTELWEIPEKRALLITYADMLIHENERINLTAVTDPSEVWEKHIIDSLTGAKYLPFGAKVIDIGSGGGCPAIPLAVCREDITITMVESVGKKVSFLTKAINTLELKNAMAENNRAETYAKTRRAEFDAVTSRALAPLRILIEYAMPLLKVNGRLVAYKSALWQKETEESENALKTLNCRIEGVYDEKLSSSDAERKIIVVEKLSETPDNFPRREGMAVKRPL